MGGTLRLSLGARQAPVPVFGQSVRTYAPHATPVAAPTSPGWSSGGGGFGRSG